jgi:hypothetical protein
MCAGLVYYTYRRLGKIAAISQGCVKVGTSTLSRPAGRIEGCGVEPFTPFDTRSALLRTLTSVTLT